MTVYLATHIASGKKYVGATTDLRKRIAEHYHDSLRKKHSTLLGKAIAQFGRDAFLWESLWEGPDKEAMWEREKHFVEMHDCRMPKGFNRATGGRVGAKHHPDTLAKLHIPRGPYKVPSWSKGLTKDTDDRVRNRSEKMRGRKFSEEHRRKISLFRMGKPCPEAAAVNRTRIGEKSATSKEWLITTPSGSEIRVKGMAQFCKAHGLNTVCMRMVGRGIQPSHRGYFCKLAA